MAGRLIVFKNSVQQVKGDIIADGYKDSLRLESVAFSATSYANSDSASGTVHQSSMMVSLPFGPWVAEFQQRLYHSTMLGDVEITEVEQRVNGNAKEWKKIREVHLMDGWIESMSHSWAGINATISMTVQYTDMTFAAGDKIAHFSRVDAKQK